MEIAIIGGGPRGISILERLTAMPPAEPLRIHFIDAVQPGAGEIWRTDQTRILCMNTLAGEVTLFTEPGASVRLPVREGPTLFEWADGTWPAGSHPERAVYGEYLRWVYAWVLEHLPDHVTVIEHTDRVVRIEGETLELASGRSITASRIVYAGGWLRTEDTPVPRRVAPNNPVDQDYSGIPAGADVMVRGLGMGFFDTMALLTLGRGGRFTEAGGGKLRYVASGREPRLIVTSRRGYPFLPKPEYGGELPPPAVLANTRRVTRELRDRPSIDFGAEVLPAIMEDARLAYDPQASAAEFAQVLERVAAPWGAPGTLESITELIADGLRGDIAEAARGAASPLKAALREIGAARKSITLLGAGGRYTPDSMRSTFKDFMAFARLVGSGPPAFRSRELLALVEAGIVRFAGRAESLSGSFSLRSRDLTQPVHAEYLIEARLPAPDIRRTADPVLRDLLEQGRIRPFCLSNDSPTASIDVEISTGRVIHRDGTVDETLHMAGIPLNTLIGFTTISPVPGTDAPMLQETDRVARSLLGWQG